MSLNKKILILFGVLFFGTLLFVPYVNASVPDVCSSDYFGDPFVLPTTYCKKVASGETENFDLYSTRFLIKNNAQTPYFIPYRTLSERELFLNSAIANPSISVTPDIGSMCFKRCAKEGSKTVCNLPKSTYVFYAARYIGMRDGAYTLTPSKTRYNYLLVKGGSTPCKNSVFGDPWQGEVKYCYYPVTCPGGGIDSNNDGKISISEYTEAVQTGSVSEDELNEVADAFAESGSTVIMRSTFTYGTPPHTYTVYKGAETGEVIVFRDNDEGVSDENALVYRDTNGDGIYEWYNTTSGTYQPLSGSTGDPNHTTFDDAVDEAEEGIDKCRYKSCGSGEYCDSNTGECKRYDDSDSDSGSGNTCTGCSYTPPAGAQCYSTYTYPC